MTLLPTIKEFIEENIELIETEDWEVVLESARKFIPKTHGHRLRMQNLIEFLIAAGFKDVKNSQYKLFDKNIRYNLRDYILDIREKTIRPDLSYRGFISGYLPYHTYGLTIDEQVQYILDNHIDKSCGAYFYQNDDGGWMVRNE